MQQYNFTAQALTDTLNPGEITSARGTLSARSVEAAKTAVETSLRSRGYEPTGSITITPK
ncbi:hypothetical protein OHA91_25875 [Streptomyces erythrochromogenes]|uniref:Uncharacterized protein n=1 Tax=Streptomyces erythrochromogenes TaxID=285574 RepID=A0ABZ1QG30_9ACTN|nr:hypothetical protein [Streptomyces erythrochromogenes]